MPRQRPKDNVITKTYNFAYRGEDHKYFLDSLEIPGTTRLLQEYGLINFDGVPQDRLYFKSVLGTAVHYAIHLHEQNNLDEDSLDERIKPYFLAYKKFCEVNRFEPRHTELRLCSKKWRFGGTLDAQGPFFWEGKEEETIIDWKCSFQMYPANAPQIAAYKILFEENYPGLKIKRRIGLQLKPTGNYEVVEYKDPNDRNLFLACVILHHWRVKHGLIKQGRLENGNNAHA